MPHRQQEVGTFTGIMAEIVSRLNFTHRRLLRFPPYRFIVGLGHSHRFLIGTPFLWLILFFLIPFLIILRISFTEAEIASPPFSDLMEWIDDGLLQITINFQNYLELWEDKIYIHAYLNSVKIGRAHV